MPRIPEDHYDKVAVDLGIDYDCLDLDRRSGPIVLSSHWDESRGEMPYRADEDPLQAEIEDTTARRLGLESGGGFAYPARLRHRHQLLSSHERIEDGYRP